MGPRGAQLNFPSIFYSIDCFNTWAREGPNSLGITLKHPLDLFQYMGPRGAQPVIKSKIRSNPLCFNTWAREGPNPHNVTR